MSNNKQDYDSDSFTWEELVEWAKGTKIFTVSDERIVAGKFEFLQNGDVYLGIRVYDIDGDPVDIKIAEKRTPEQMKSIMKNLNNIQLACCKTAREIELEKKLDIAVKALEFYEKPFSCFHPEYNIAQHHKKAAEALAKIKEQQMKTTCDICGKEIIGVENFVDAGDKVVCSQKCLETAISEFYHWQNTKG